jgi:GT2 family glycosyltransferase
MLLWPKRGYEKRSKFDIVIWVRNGEGTLPVTLKRIRQVIPSEFVEQRIMVDDHSTDASKKIGESFGWNVVPNPDTGISAGANHALSLVQSEYFASFEQDIFLATDWWPRIPSLVLREGADVASGLRFVDKPLSVRAIQEYSAQKCFHRRRFETAKVDTFILGRSFDNTFYRTDTIKAIGGFPKANFNSGLDTVLAYKLQGLGYKWRVEYHIQSIHLHGGLSTELQKQFWYWNQLPQVLKTLQIQVGVKLPVTKFNTAIRLFSAPLIGFRISLKTHVPGTFIVYPLQRLYSLMGMLKAG